VQSSSQIITTNKPTSSFYRPDALPVTQPTVSKHCREKISDSMDLLTPSSPGGHPTLSLTANSSWLPWGEDCYASHQPSDASTPTRISVWPARNLMRASPKSFLETAVRDQPNERWTRKTGKFNRSWEKEFCGKWLFRFQCCCLGSRKSVSVLPANFQVDLD